MYRKYIFCKNNYLNILIFSILIFCIIIGLNIYENMESKIKSEDLPENRTFLITFRNIINIEKTLEKCNNIVEYEQISYVNKNSQNIEIYEVILDKEESISIIEKELNGKSIKIKKKYENNILSDKLANLLYKIIRYYLIIVYIFMIIINYFFISKIIVSEKNYLQRIEQDIKTQFEIIKKTQIELEEQQIAVNEAYKEVKVLEKLKEKQYKNFLFEYEQNQIKELDDITNSRRKKVI